MGYTIPNSADAFTAAQAAPDKVDFDAIVAGSGQTGVVSGLTGTVTGSSMVVSISAGVACVAGKEIAVAAGSATIAAANASLNRFDLVVVSSAGVISAVTGTASSNPVFPAIPANSVLLYAVYVSAAATTILSNRLVDKRVPVLRDDGFMAYFYF